MTMTEAKTDGKPIRPRPTKPRPRPIAAEASWLIEPIPCRDFEVGYLAINDTEYTVTMPQDHSGARLTKCDATREQYHVDLTTGECDCPDHQYRGRECKHHRSLVAVLAPSAARQKHSCCPRCNDLSEGGHLCPGCTVEAEAEQAAFADAYFAPAAPEPVYEPCDVPECPEGYEDDWPPF